MKCGHEAWEEYASSRKCADCGEWLDPIVKPAADFQVGDRVSVEGVVTQLWPDARPGPLTLVRVVGEGYEDDSELWFADQALTLVDRPRRKLRVGSVWECNGAQRYVYLGKDMFSGWLPDEPNVERSRITLDETPEHWREVPVEELEAEANA